MPECPQQAGERAEPPAEPNGACPELLGSRPLTCRSFMPTSCSPFLSNRRMISPTRCLCTPSGLMATNVRSLIPPQPAKTRRGVTAGKAATADPQPRGRGPGPVPFRTIVEEAGKEAQHQANHGGAAHKGAAPGSQRPLCRPVIGGAIVLAARRGGAGSAALFHPGGIGAPRRGSPGRRWRSDGSCGRRGCTWLCLCGRPRSRLPALGSAQPLACLLD